MFRGAVSPPFIEELPPYTRPGWTVTFRGAVSPPFIEELTEDVPAVIAPMFRGAVSPPFIEDLRCSCVRFRTGGVSGGGQPPLH